MPIEVAFHPARIEDLDLLERWMAQPHWRQWWGDPVVELSQVRKMIEGEDTTRPYIFYVDGEATGYIQHWSVGDHQQEPWTDDNPWLAELPGDCVGVDISIGDASKLSRGIGSAVLRKFVDMLAARGHKSIIIDPDHHNTRAVRAYRKAGFRPIANLEGRTEGILLMEFEADRIAT